MVFEDVHLLCGGSCPCSSLRRSFPAVSPAPSIVTVSRSSRCFWKGQSYHNCPEEYFTGQYARGRNFQTNRLFIPDLPLRFLPAG
jgi:hypothetical protein